MNIEKSLDDIDLDSDSEVHTSDEESESHDSTEEEADAEDTDADEGEADAEETDGESDKADDEADAETDGESDKADDDGESDKADDDGESDKADDDGEAGEDEGEAGEGEESGDNSICTSDIENTGNGSNMSIENLVDTGSSKRKRKADKWLKECKYYQKTTDLLLPRLPFKKLVREIAQDYITDIRFSENSFEAIQTGTEEFIIELLGSAQNLAIHRNADTIIPKDMQMILAIMQKMQWKPL
jgi:histone H3/H4